MDADQKQANMRRAVGIMTAWLESDASGDDLLIEQVLGDVGPGDDPEVASIFGLVGLCGHLLIKREKEAGISPEDTLRELAIKYQ